MRHHLRFAIALPLALTIALVAGCSSGDDDDEDDTSQGTATTVAETEDPLGGRTFIGESIEVDGEPVVAPGAGTFEVGFAAGSTEGSGTITAAAACATLRIGYTIVPEGLMTNGFMSANEDCDPAEAEFDELLGQLIRSPAFQLDGDDLSLLAEGGAGELGAELTEGASTLTDDSSASSGSSEDSTEDEAG